VINKGIEQIHWAQTTGARLKYDMTQANLKLIIYVN